ncbi:MAG: hypothetical protein GTO17_07675 [Candidatus Aminicenantes bacterium]|nr:hypothetical protein [Candidatus Aminicenantes bacterium]
MPAKRTTKKATKKAAKRTVKKAKKATPRKTVKAAPKKKIAPKKKAAPRKKTAKVKKGETYQCQVCGVGVVVDEACGCVEEHTFICCMKPMKKRAKKKK